jgi:hypothetical protein
MAKKSKKQPRRRHSDDSSNLRDQIETERSRLVRCEAVLMCIACTLADSKEDVEPPDPSDLRYVVDIAREFVRETINRLDSVNLDYPPR